MCFLFFKTWNDLFDKSVSCISVLIFHFFYASLPNTTYFNGQSYLLSPNDIHLKRSSNKLTSSLPMIFIYIVFCNKSTLNAVISPQTIKTLCQNKVFVIPVFLFFKTRNYLFDKSVSCISVLIFHLFYADLPNTTYVNGQSYLLSPNSIHLKRSTNKLTTTK